MTEGHTERLETALDGKYRIERKLGEGGMATVYLAEDIKHERKVALKILRPELAAVIGAERFISEIKTTANLQHPHILPLFDSGEADGYLYYVMPFIDGETLRDRIEREQQLGVDDAVRIARDVADALDYAHRNDVIHRDIKPANILLHDGRPVVADFGIALAISAAGGGRMTETGLSLGTPHYMSPEQASADRDLSARSDVYSLGCVLYEMLAGQPPHTGPSAQSILVRILTESARPLTEMRHTVPPHISAVVAKSIEKLPADRFDTAKQFMDALEDAAFTYTANERAPQVSTASMAVAPVAATKPARRWAPWAVAATMTAVAAWAWFVPSGDLPDVPVRWALTGFEGRFGSGGGEQLAISPDGRVMVVVGLVDGDDRLYVRRSDATTFTALPDTEGAKSPSFSPDGLWLAFSRDQEVRKLAIAGGPTLPVVTGDAPHWGTQETIVFAGADGIYTVSSSGGEATLVAADSASGGRLRWPHLLPDGSGVLAALYQGATPRVVLIGLETHEWTEIADGTSPTFVPTGHIVYGSHDQAGFAIPFDLRSKELRGTPVPVLPSLTVYSGGATQLAVSENGTLIYSEAALDPVEASSSTSFAWVAMDGTVTDVPLEMEQSYSPRLSPDGRRITYTAARQIWIYDTELGSNTQLTIDGTDNEDSFFSPDGRYVYFSSEREGSQDEDGYRKATDFISEAEQLYSLPFENQPVSISPDARWVVVRDETPDQQDNLKLVAAEPGGEQRDYLRADWDEREGVVSPNGRWMAYSSTEFGPSEIFVRAFPDPAEKWQVSQAGGHDPVWAPDGSAIYYVSEPNLVKTNVDAGETFSVGTTEALFPWIYNSSRADLGFDIHPDGDRFIVARSAAGGGGFGEVHVVTDWFEELKERMGEGN